MATAFCIPTCHVRGCTPSRPHRARCGPSGLFGHPGLGTRSRPHHAHCGLSWLFSHPGRGMCVLTPPAAVRLGCLATLAGGRARVLTPPTAVRLFGHPGWGTWCLTVALIWRPDGSPPSPFHRVIVCGLLLKSHPDSPPDFDCIIFLH